MLFRDQTLPGFGLVSVPPAVAAGTNPATLWEGKNWKHKAQRSEEAQLLPIAWTLGTYSALVSSIGPFATIAAPFARVPANHFGKQFTPVRLPRSVLIFGVIITSLESSLSGSFAASDARGIAIFAMSNNTSAIFPLTSAYCVTAETTPVDSPGQRLFLGTQNATFGGVNLSITVAYKDQPFYGDITAGVVVDRPVSRAIATSNALAVLSEAGFENCSNVVAWGTSNEVFVPAVIAQNDGVMSQLPMTNQHVVGVNALDDVGDPLFTIPLTAYVVSAVQDFVENAP